MQVRKFEARSMKEALEMVKTQLGPEAIILSARDNKKRFGLVGEGSVEITAAVSEETLQKKKFAESRLREQDRNKLQQSSARVQKQVIEKMVKKYTQEAEVKSRPITQQRYIDIAEDGYGTPSVNVVTPMTAVSAEERIKSAAQSALNMMSFHQSPPAPKPLAQQNSQQGQMTSSSVGEQKDWAQISALKTEIESLKKVISGFQAMPQHILGQHPGAEYGLSYEVCHMFQKLQEAGLAPEIAADLLTQTQEEMPLLKLKNKSLVDGYVAKKILETTKLAAKRDPKIQIFVGPAGSGKTSTLVKLASHMIIKDHKKIALVTLDTFKVGAVDQLKIFSQILNVPFAVVRNRQEWDRLMVALSGYDCILVDAPGLSLKNMDEISFLRNLLPGKDEKIQVHLVLSALAKDSDLNEIGKRYQVTHFDDLIFTGIDEAAQHGNVYNFMRRFNAPLHSFGLGARVPEDFEIATRERLLDLIFKISKMKKEQSL
jgi:flagellar biosynthesis protein FlhF